MRSDHDHSKGLRISEDSCWKGRDKLNDISSPVDSFTLSSSGSQEWQVTRQNNFKEGWRFRNEQRVIDRAVGKLGFTCLGEGRGMSVMTMYYRAV